MTEATLGFKIDSSQASSAALDLEKLVTASTKTERAADSLEGAAKNLGGALQGVGAGAGGAKTTVEQLGRAFGSQDEHVRAFRQELERLTDKYAPMARATKAYEASLADITRAHQLGILNAQQMQKAIDAERLSYERLKTAASGAGQAVKAANQNNTSGAARAAGVNAGYQFQDIAVTAAMGMNPLMIGLQQGTQLASVVASMEKPVAGLAGAFTSLISPVSLVTIGLTAGVAALIQYFMTWRSGADDMNTKLKEQQELISDLASKWGGVVPALKEYADQLERANGARELRQGASIINEQTLDKTKKQIDDARLSFGALTQDLQQAGDSEETIVKIQDAFNKFTTSADKGALKIEDVKRVQDALAEVIQGKGIPAVSEFSKLFDTLSSSALNASGSVQKVNDAVSQSIPTSAWRSYNPDTGKLGLDGQTSEGPIQGESFMLPENGPRIESRPKIELDYLPGEQKDLEKQQSNYDRAIDSAKQRIAQTELEAEVAGKLGAASDALRFKLNLLHDAQDKGKEITADQRKEIDALTESYQRAAAAAADARFNAALTQQSSDARLSARDRQIIQTQRQYGLTEDVNNTSGQRIGQQMDWQNAKDTAKSWGSTFSNELISSGGDIGKSFGKAFQSELEKQAQNLWGKFFDQVGNIFADLVTGKSGGAGSSGGGLVGSVAAALGGKAANNNTPGGYSGLASVIPVTRAPLGDIGSYAKAIQSIESGGNYGALGPVTRNGDRAYGAYQVMGNNIGPWSKDALGRSVSTDEFLKNPSIQDQVFQNKFGGYVNQYGPSGAAQAWFGGPGSVGKGGAGADILGTTGTAYVEKFNSALGDASKNVGTFGNGLGKVGESLSTNFFPAAPSAVPGGAAGGGGGGLFGWLGGLFGGGSQWSKAASGKITGLFADGTNYAPGGMAIVGERGPELVNLPQGSQVFNTNKSAQMMSGAGQGGGGIANVRVFMDEDGNWQSRVTSISRDQADEKSRQNIASYQKTQERSGFGRDQAIFNKRKG